MTQEEKQLLLKDLCARLPYRVKGRVYAECSNGEYDMNGDMIFFDSPFDVTLDDINISTEELHVIAIGNEDTIAFIEDQQTWGSPYTIDEFKPYLRPLSSMTKEERMELECLSAEYFGKALDKQIQESLSSSNRNESRILEYIASSVIIDWLNAHHFDYRGLIPIGLGIDCTGLNIYENEKSI